VTKTVNVSTRWANTLSLDARARTRRPHTTDGADVRGAVAMVIVVVGGRELVILYRPEQGRV